MKKLYTVLFAAMMTLCANAGLYLAGNFCNWFSDTNGKCNPKYEFKETSTAGVYTVSVDELANEFLICSAGADLAPDWTALRFGSNGQPVKEGQTYNAVKGGVDNFKMEGTVIGATVTLDTNKNTILVEGTAQANSFTVVYLVGAINGGTWNESLTTYPLASKGNDTYEGDIEITSASWLKPRCGNQVLSATGSDLVPVMGETYTLSTGDKAVALQPGNYTVTVVADQKAESCKITFNSKGDIPTPAKDVYFYGNIDEAGWTPETLTDGSFTFEVAATAYLSFSDGEPAANWGNVWRPEGYADVTLTANGTYKSVGYGSNGAWKITSPGTYTVTPDAATKSFTITGFSGVTPDPTPAKDVYFYGAINLAPEWTSAALTNGSHTFTVTKDSYFSFSDGEPADDWGNVWRPDGYADVTLTANGTYKSVGYGSTGAWKISEPGTYTVTPDAATKSFTITGFSGVIPDPTYPETVYIMGYINGKDFSDTDKVEPQTKAEDGVYTWQDVTIGDATAGTGEAAGYIAFCTVKGTTVNDWDTVNSGDRYGAPAKDAPLAIGTPADVKLYAVNVSASASESWKVTPGAYDVILNLKDMKVSLTKATSGIEDIEAADAVAPVYYNLQGVRVMNPENGIFIEVRGNKAVKVIR